MGRTTKEDQIVRCPFEIFTCNRSRAECGTAVVPSSLFQESSSIKKATSCTIEQLKSSQDPCDPTWRWKKFDHEWGLNQSIHSVVVTTSTLAKAFCPLKEQMRNQLEKNKLIKLTIYVLMNSFVQQLGLCWTSRELFELETAWVKRKSQIQSLLSSDNEALFKWHHRNSFCKCWPSVVLQSNSTNMSSHS